ncbi:MAG TPA: hypothetical protein PKV16_04035 [Caldisericia bacterium]|nr:hypothetical protein [Caldisericia bacterium]HPF48480.1 hypothetical protein [Caldisericia bacterium]HPI83340.1 hypothetical protein [Caldisericia bacterium]HPQ92934.1 hypothetical protein [Caldisericia bacterium]HRV73968.1 hypothetical protein [Caldisericia bacterium]
MARMTVPRSVVLSALFLISAIITSVLVFGSVSVGPVLEEEKSQIEAWIAWEGFNYFGDPMDFRYPEGEPRFDSEDERYDYIRSNNRARPWQKIQGEWLVRFSDSETEYFKMWVEDEDLNTFGDPHGTVYAGGTPLFDEMNGNHIPLDSYALSNHPKRPWLRYTVSNDR